MSGDAWVNTDAGFWDGPDQVGSARDRVLKIQAKLHLWAKSDPDRRFGDLFNLVADPAFLIEAWVRVRGNKGPGRRAWTARRPTTSSPNAARWRFWVRCGPRCGRARSPRCRSRNG